MGIGLPDFKFSHGITKVETLVSHLLMHSTLVTLIRIIIEWFQITAGTQTSILKETSPIRYIYCPWVQSLQHFLRKTNAKLRYPGMWTPTPQQQNDKCLMDIFRRDKGLHLGRINAVRLYLKIFYISNISTAGGCHLLDMEINQKGAMGRKSKLKWTV